MIAEDAAITKTFHVKHALPRPEAWRKLPAERGIALAAHNKSNHTRGHV